MYVKLTIYSLICGSESQISKFSISVPGGPHTTIYTKTLRPSSPKGIISALSVSQDSLLAAGKFNNSISLFSHTYEHITTFSTTHGTGITELHWSPDSRYLYVTPRQSAEIEVWDVRSTGEMVACLSGRRGRTNQRLWGDLSADGRWFLSGGTDGVVRGWRTDVLAREVEPSWEVKAHDGMNVLVFLCGAWLIVDCVCSATLHPSWPMLATGSGSNHFIHDDDDDDKVRIEDYSLKVWVFE